MFLIIKQSQRLTLTCMTALNQHVFPTFFSPTGQLSCLFLSYGLGESLHTSVCVRFRLALFSAMLASRTLKHKDTKHHFCLIAHGIKEFWYHSTCYAIHFILKSAVKSTVKTPPADSLLFIGYACLSEGPVRLLQTEGDGPLQVIFIISSEINYIWNKSQEHPKVGY